MLPSVAGQNQPSMPLVNQPDKFQHLTPANLSGFIHDDDGAVRQFTLEQKVGNCCGRRKSSLLHLHHLLTLRREDDHAPARLSKLLDEFTKDKTLACACAAAKDRHAVG